MSIKFLERQVWRFEIPLVWKSKEEFSLLHFEVVGTMKKKWGKKRLGLQTIRIKCSGMFFFPRTGPRTSWRTISGGLNPKGHLFFAFSQEVLRKCLFYEQLDERTTFQQPFAASQISPIQWFKTPPVIAMFVSLLLAESEAPSVGTTLQSCEMLFQDGPRGWLASQNWLWLPIGLDLSIWGPLTHFMVPV